MEKIFQGNGHDQENVKTQGTSVIAALVALCAVVGYGLTEWAPLG